METHIVSEYTERRMKRHTDNLQRQNKKKNENNS